MKNRRTGTWPSTSTINSGKIEGKIKDQIHMTGKKSKEKLQEQGKHYLEVEKKHSLVKNTCTSETVCAILWFGSTTKYPASMSSKQVSFSTAAATP